MVVSDHIEVKLASNEFNMSLQLLLEDLLFHFLAEHHGGEFLLVEPRFNVIRKQLLSVVLLERGHVLLSNLVLHSFEVEEFVGHLEDAIRLLDHLLLGLVDRYFALLLLLEEFVLDLVVHGLVSIGPVLLRGHARALLFCQPHTVTVRYLVLDAAVSLVINDLVQIDQALHTALGLRLQFHFLLFIVGN